MGPTYFELWVMETENTIMPLSLIQYHKSQEDQNMTKLTLLY